MWLAVAGWNQTDKQKLPAKFFRLAAAPVWHIQLLKREKKSGWLATAAASFSGRLEKERSIIEFVFPTFIFPSFAFFLSEIRRTGKQIKGRNSNTAKWGEMKMIFKQFSTAAADLGKLQNWARLKNNKKVSKLFGQSC